MDVIAIAIVGAGIVMACAGAFLVLTAPDDALPDDGELGGEGFIAVRPDRQPVAPPADSELGLAAGNGGGPFFQFGDDAFVFRNERPAAPVVPRPRSRFRLVK